MTKRDIVQSAFTESGIAPHVFQLQGGDIAFGLQLLEAYVLHLDASGIETEWEFDNDPLNVDGDAVVNCAPHLIVALVPQLAIDLCAAFGKTPTPTTMIRANRAKTDLFGMTAIPDAKKISSLVPLGSGNKPWRQVRTFVRPVPSRKIDVSYTGDVPEVGGGHE